MFLKQYYLSCLAHASYMIADEATHQAAVVDPQRDIDQYLEDAKTQGFEIRYVILTHFHADFLAGHLDLRNRVGAKIVLGARAKADFEFRAVTDGDTIELGMVRLQFMETPGHTPEGISILVFDPEHSVTTPKALLSGDTLFIGDVGRPDLLASVGVTADELADMLYASVQRLRELPDDVLLYPAHGAGSMCGKNLSKDTVSTLGQQKQSNYALQPMSLEQFKAMVTHEQPEAPRYFVYDAIKNRTEHDDLAHTLAAELQPRTLDEVLALRDGGAKVLDVRAAADFAAQHLTGSINIGLEGSYATWCGTILSPEDDIVLVAAPGVEREAAMRLGRIGYDRVRGYLEGGATALAARPDQVSTLPRITAAELYERLTAQDAPLVLDVRTQAEVDRGRIEGSVHIPMPHLAERIAEVAHRGSIVVHCQGGYRSPIAACLLRRAGVDDVADLVGGYNAWAAAQGPSDASAAGAQGGACAIPAAGSCALPKA